MRSHAKENTKERFPQFELSLSYIQQYHHKEVKRSETTFNKKAVYKIPGEEGLFTFDELVKRFMH